jgi:hypothetical protein
VIVGTVDVKYNACSFPVLGELEGSTQDDGIVDIQTDSSLHHTRWGLQRSTALWLSNTFWSSKRIKEEGTALVCEGNGVDVSQNEATLAKLLRNGNFRKRW